MWIQSDLTPTPWLNRSLVQVDTLASIVIAYETADILLLRKILVGPKTKAGSVQRIQMSVDEGRFCSAHSNVG
jgi:hypothetical protein